MNTHLPEHRSIPAGRAPRFRASSRRLAAGLCALALAGMSLVTSGCVAAASDEPLGTAGEALSNADPTLVSNNETGEGSIGEKGTVTWSCGPGCICYADGSIDCRHSKEVDVSSTETLGAGCMQYADGTLDCRVVSSEDAEKGLPWLCGPNCVCYPDGSFDCRQIGMAKQGVTWACPCDCICYSDGSIDCRKQPAM